MPTIRFVPAGMLTLRASVVPLEETYEWRRSSAARVDGRPSEWLLSTLDDPLFREAIVVASRDLPGRLIALREEILGAPGGSINRDAQRALQSWARYAMRAIGRPTPYGLFAGVALCGIGDEDSLYLSTQHCRCVQLDAWVLDRLVNEIARDLRTCLSYVPNSTLYTCGGQWRFTERLLTATGRVTYDLAAVVSEHSNAATTERLKSGHRG